jgi:hypothetical protein
MNAGAQRALSVVYSGDTREGDRHLAKNAAKGNRAHDPAIELNTA